jgi:hypothetical protein
MRAQHGAVGDGAECQNHCAGFESAQLGGEKCVAGRDFSRRRFIGGGTHFTAFVMRQPVSRNPSSRETDAGALDQPNAYSVS